MYSKLFLVYLVLVLVRSCFCQNNLCSLSKLDDTCRCLYKTCEVTHLPELYADCRWIELGDFPRIGQFPDKPKHLDLSHNNLKSIETDFTNELLIELVVSYNNINYIDFGFFENLPKLEILDLSHNSFEKLDSNAFKGLSKLTNLDLSFNQIKILPDNLFTPIQNLQVLNLGYNDLGKSLEDTNNIFAADFDLTDNITSLSLAKLNLKSINSNFFGDSTNIKHLSLADNYFDDIPVIPTSVTNFDFSGNNVSVLTVRHLNYHGIKVLNLNRMRILESIDKYALYNMANLEELYMENCPRLRELNSLAFGVIRQNPDDIKLKRLSLFGSGLQRINETYLHLFKQLDYINLQSNPWICNCDILWMQLLNGTFHKSENMRCISPLNLRNKKIMSLTSKQLPNCLVNPSAVRLQKILVPVLGVVIMLLLVLIVYLVYMGPFIYRNYRAVGPESPYHDVTMLR